MPMTRYEHGFIEALFESEELGLGLIDSDLRYVRVNEALARINGVAAEDHVGRTIQEVIPDFADLAQPILRQVLGSALPVIAVEIEGPSVPDLESQTYFRVSFFPITEDGAVIGIAALVLDVTARVHSELDLKQQASEIYENVVQDLVVIELAHEAGDLPRASAAAQRALASARKIASKVLLGEGGDL